jgi:CBS domain-containing protein
MTPQPEAVEEGDAVRVAINKMAVGGYRHVPIVRDGYPVGMISAKRVANHILKYSSLDF